MRRSKRRYVGDLRTWELPRLSDLELELAGEFAQKAKAVYLDRELFSEELYRLFLTRLRTLAGAAVNETIEYWLKGFGDGNSGRFPELAVELPYLERDENTDALMLAYCVANEDGTRTELIRATLEAVLLRILDAHRKPKDLDLRLKVVAAELRALAGRLEAPLQDITDARTPRMLA